MKGRKQEQKILKDYALFDDAEEMVSSLDALMSFIFDHYLTERIRSPSNILGFIVERLDITFSKSIGHIEMKSEFGKNTITILAPEIEHEQIHELEQRRLKLLKDFSPIIKETQLRATVQLYQLLSPLGKDRLIKECVSKK